MMTAPEKATGVNETDPSAPPVVGASRDSPAAFREAMALLASGVVMVTTRIDGRPWGLTISSCTSLSADPPQVLVSLGTKTVTAKRISETGHFGISLLSSRQRELAEVGAATGAPKFVDDHCEDDGNCDPRVRGALYHLDCAVSHETVIADHTIFVGEVSRWEAGTMNPAEPLIYFGREYRGITEDAV